MKWGVFWGCLCCCLAYGIDEETPLPQWSEADAQRVMHGESLISDALFRLPADHENPLLNELQGDGLILPEPGPDSLTIFPPTEIPEEDLVKYFSKKPKSLLLDPQKLMSRQEYRDRLSFLKYHASDSDVDFYVYLFDEQQIIPPIIRTEDLFDQYFLSGRPAVVVFYFMGAPERSEIYLSPTLMRAVGVADRDRALQSSINQAIVKSQHVDQLDGFCVQMSIRIYWMEKAMESGVVARTPPTDQEDSNKQKNAVRIVAVKTWLEEWKIPLASLSGVIIVAGIAGAIRRRRERCYFTEYEVSPRLGGAHAAGVGAVISYASARVSPTMQREQVPDYLRRL